MADNEIIQALQSIGNTLVSIESIMREGHDATMSIQQEAMIALEVHKEGAQQYLHTIEQSEPIDPYPFKELPAGTLVRDLPDGGSLFQFADGANIVFSQEGSIVATDTSGTTTILEPALGGKIMTPDGREFDLVHEALQATHESAGIEGLPVGVEPIKVAETRYRVDLRSGVRIDVDQQRRMVLVCDISGSILLIGIDRTEGFAEAMDVRLLGSGSKGFQAQESGHKGFVEEDGTIHLSLVQGQDLIFRFPTQDEYPNDSNDVDSKPTKKICEEND